MEKSNDITCPKCGSSQFVANKKGFSGKKAAVGALLSGGIGLLAGTIGKDQIIITCLNCGNKFKPGDSRNNGTADQPANNQASETKPESTSDKVANIGCLAVVVVFVGLLVAYLIKKYS